jgi:hypothetical protein
MKNILKPRNVKAQVPIMVKGNKKTEFAVKNPPNLKPMNKRAKVRV